MIQPTAPAIAGRGQCGESHRSHTPVVRRFPEDSVAIPKRGTAGLGGPGLWRAVHGPGVSSTSQAETLGTADPGDLDAGSSGTAE